MNDDLILDKQDLTYLSWARVRQSSGTAGSFLKSYSELGGRENSLRLAPLFDHGLSLLFSCRKDSEAEAFDVMADRPVNTFFGSKSTRKNLELIPADRMPTLNGLKESDRTGLMDGLDEVISETMRNKIWEMIWKRWCAYEDFCGSR